MNNTERIVKVLWDPEEEVTSDLRLQRGMGICSLQSDGRAMQAKGPVLVKTEVRKEAQYFGEVTDGACGVGRQVKVKGGQIYGEERRFDFGW